MSTFFIFIFIHIYRKVFINISILYRCKKIKTGGKSIKHRKEKTMRKKIVEVRVTEMPEVTSTKPQMTPESFGKEVGYQAAIAATSALAAGLVGLIINKLSQPKTRKVDAAKAADDLEKLEK